jgi:hypothetical protein
MDCFWTDITITLGVTFDQMVNQALVRPASSNAAIGTCAATMIALLLIAVTVGAFLLVTWVATKGLFFFLQESPIR